MNLIFVKTFAFTCLALFLGAARLCDADTIYNVTLNTAPLVGNPNGPFALDFELTDGNSNSTVVNTATLSHFTFGTGGSAGTGTPQPNSGHVSGNLTSGANLSTSGGSFFNEFSQNFNPGTALSFQLDLTNNAQTGGTPDEFSFYILDGTSSIPTVDPGGSLFYVDLTGGTLSPHIFAANGDGVTIMPQLTAVTPVPEPASSLLVLSAAALLLAVSRRAK